MKYLVAVLGAAMCLASCNCNNKCDASKEAAAEAQDSTVTVDGQWKLTEYNAADSIVKVAEDNDYVLTFTPADSTFNLTTDCNSIGGQYTIKGDSIKLDNLFSTRMMCENMDVETAMNAVLPTVQTVKVTNDTVLSFENNGKAVATFVKK